MEMRKKEMRYSPAYILWTGMLLFFLCVNGCAMVGPDFVRPKTEVKQEWVEAGDKHIKETQPKYKIWWKVFEARALLGISVS